VSTFQGKESVFRSQHAVVIGGSIAGLLAGRALADHFDVVTIIERDRFPQSVAVRKGVPQAQHNHALLSKGMLLMQQFFPDLFPTLLQRGSTRLDTSLDLEWYQHGVWKIKVATGIDVYSQSRPLIEDEIRHQLARHENVRFMDACEVTQLCTNEDKTRISGVHIQYHDGQAKKETLRADLVIDASGRGSQTSRWLSCLGYPEIKESVVKVNVGYSSRIYLRPAHLPAWKIKLVFPTPPAGKRGGSIFSLENNRWMLSLVGWAHDYPSDKEAEFLEFARSLPLPDIYEAMKDAEPLTPIALYKFPASRRRHYERAKRFPSGLLVLGDALASFNPTYGQGMTVAAIAADVLHTWLNRRQHYQDRHMEWTFGCQKAIARTVEIPWLLSTSEDFRYPETEGYRMPGLRFLQWYAVRANKATAYNERVTRRFWEVLHMLKHPLALFAPDVLFTILFAKSERFNQPQESCSSTSSFMQREGFTH
jgi:2-polyprenyl-6-methoxyphenol hydroxylase-like FAD-dependent oxidoreductase